MGEEAETMKLVEPPRWGLGGCHEAERPVHRHQQSLYQRPTQGHASIKTAILFPLLIALMCGALLAEPSDVNGRIQSTTPGGFPDGWVMHEWSGYKPFPDVKTIPGVFEGNTALSITNVLGDDGGAIQTRAKFPARSGAVGRSENVVKLLRKNGKTGPYLGKPIQLPGEIMLSHYDEGGQGFAYSDGTPGNNASKTFRANEDVDAGETVIGGVSGGEWLKYTVHVNRTANDTFTLEYGTPSPKQRGPKLMVDCQAAGDFETPAHEFPDWRHTSKAVLKSVPLSAGDHEIVLLMQGSYNLGGLKVEAE